MTTSEDKTTKRFVALLEVSSSTRNNQTHPFSKFGLDRGPDSIHPRQHYTDTKVSSSCTCLQPLAIRSSCSSSCVAGQILAASRSATDQNSTLLGRHPETVLRDCRRRLRSSRCCRQAHLPSRNHYSTTTCRTKRCNPERSNLCVRLYLVPTHFCRRSLLSTGSQSECQRLSQRNSSRHSRGRPNGGMRLHSSRHRQHRR